MKSLFVTLFAVLSSASAMAHPGPGGHLKFADGAIHAHLSWIQGPAASGESKMRLEWHDGTTHELMEPGLPFTVSLFMPSMGHGSSPTQMQRILDSQGRVIVGTYQISSMYFVMGGDWDIRVKLKYQNGTEETQVWRVNVGGDDHGGHH